MKPRIVTLLCCVAGLLLVAGGAWAIAAYVQAVAADLSMLFWALVIAGLGMALLGAGAGFLLLAYKSSREASAAVLARRALLGLCLLSAVVAVAGHFRLRQVQAGTLALEREAATRAERQRSARKLDSLELGTRGHEALLVRARPTPGLDGRYRWTLQVSSNEATLFESSRVLSLQGAATPITQSVRFDDLFAGCFAPTPVQAYACVRNAEAGDAYTVQARLELMDDHIDDDASRMTQPPIRSTRTALLTLDTRASDDAVKVLGVEIPER